MNIVKDKILQEFLNSYIKITSQEKLEQYIEYCIYNNQKDRIKDKEGYSLSAYHHMLPEALFDGYKDLKENPWNGTHLLYSDHYYAHWLLTEAIDDYGQLNAFCAMHNKDIKLGKINESDLIPPEEFQKKMEERGRKYSEWCSNNPEKLMEKSKKHSEFMSQKTLIEGKYQSIAEYNANLRAIRERNTYIGDKNMIDIRISKTVNTRRKNGWDTTKHQESMKQKQENGKTKQENTTLKMAKTRQLKKISFEGKEMTIKEMCAIKTSRKARERAKKYDVYNSKGEKVYCDMIRLDIIKIHTTLFNTSEDKPLGSTTQSINKLRKLNKMNLSGLYIKETNNPLLS